MEERVPPLDIAVFGGSFNPPGLHHRAMAEALLGAFGQVLVVPCGFRPDKSPRAGLWLGPELRRRLVELTFEGLGAAVGAEGGSGRLEYDWSDLAAARFTPTIDLAARLAGRGRLWFVAGADLFAGGGRGESQIQTEWKEGPRIWRELSWACLSRPGFVFDPADLPPCCRVVPCRVEGSSSEIRRRLAAGEDLEGLVVPGAAGLLAQALAGLARTASPS